MTEPIRATTPPSPTPAFLPVLPIRIVEDPDPDTTAGAIDPAAVILTCANCGAPMDERKCKLICRCGYFLSCSDYY